jgi:hypothetical protein
MEIMDLQVVGADAVECRKQHDRAMSDVTALGCAREMDGPFG